MRSSFLIAVGLAAIAANGLAQLPGVVAASALARKPNRFLDGASMGNLSTTYTEYSGLAPAQKVANKGYLWAIEDGATAYVLAINKATAALAGKWTITMTSTDVEDVDSATVEGQAYVYLCDSGDNANARATFKIIRIKEPTITGSDDTVAGGDTEEITVEYPAGDIPSHKDAEALLVDPHTGDMYIVTKRISPVKLYRLAHAASYSGTQTLVDVGDLTADAAFNTISTTVSGNNGYVTGGSIAPNGTEILLRSYREVWRFPRTVASQSILQALQGTPALMMGYVGGGDRFLHPQLEPQGEAVCFDQSGSAVYTCSENVANRGTTASAYPLYRYGRVGPAVTTHTFQEGAASYAGTTDTYLDQSAPTTDNGAGTSMVCDFDYSAFPTVSRVRAGLLRFDVSSISSSAIVIGAQLDVYINTEGLGMTFYKMLSTWSEASTYNSLTAGVSLDDVECSSSAFATIIDAAAEGIDTYTGTYRVNIPAAIVQSWVTSSANNFGVYITGPTESTGDGLQLDTSEGATAGRRPLLTVRTITP